jgi:glyoxylase-like metal-dependent hydrolase (beta-lactamase superfamily II)
MKIQFRSDELIIFESALFRTTTSLIIGEQYILLIDPNWLPIELDFIENIIESLGENIEKYLLFTHSDYDHIIGYGKFKTYKTIASKNFIKNKDQEIILKQIEKFDDEYYVKRGYKIEYPKIELSISKDNEKLQIGFDEYQFYQAKGHNQDGIFIFNKTKKILIAGDYLSNIEFPYIYDSLKEYKQTLSKFENVIQQESINILVPGHGDFTTDHKGMIKRIKESSTYIRELETSIIEQTVFNEQNLYPRYQFPIIMNQFHQNNIKLVKTELGMK